MAHYISLCLIWYWERSIRITNNMCDIWFGLSNYFGLCFSDIFIIIRPNVSRGTRRGVGGNACHGTRWVSCPNFSKAPKRISVHHWRPHDNTHRSSPSSVYPCLHKTELQPHQLQPPESTMSAGLWRLREDWSRCWVHSHSSNVSKVSISDSESLHSMGSCCKCRWR